jgi:lysozyme family protein
VKNSDVIEAAQKVSDRFATWLTFILQWEVVTNSAGDIVAEHDPDDPGGLTFAGVDKASHPDFPYNSPTPRDVVAAYLEDWDAICGDKLPAPIGEVVGNFAVNCGRIRAIKWLQQAANRQPAVSLNMDGQIGPKTVAAAGLGKPDGLATSIIANATTYYRDLAVENKSLSKFLKGWLNRCNSLALFTSKISQNQTQIA